MLTDPSLVQSGPVGVGVCIGFSGAVGLSVGFGVEAAGAVGTNVEAIEAVGVGAIAIDDEGSRDGLATAPASQAAAIMATEGGSATIWPRFTAHLALVSGLRE